jgi:protein-S-isoprenylcysteine O-methyltransferase Ste14
VNLAPARDLSAYHFPARAAGTSVRRLATGDLVSRISIVTLFSFLTFRLASDAAQTGHVTGLLLLVSESLVVVLTMIRRPAGAVDRSAVARVLTGLSTVGPLLVRAASNAAAVPDVLTVMITGLGLIFVVVGKLTLGRSFGLAPANRGVVSTGVYRFVRHPIYVGYLIAHVGFLIAHPLTWNLVILPAADIALLLRARCEERTLAEDPAYLDYMQRVRWRLVPGVF